MPATKYELRNGTGTRFMFPEVNVDDIRNNAVSGDNSGGSFSTTTVPNVTRSYTQIAPSVVSCASFGGCKEIVRNLNNSLNNCNLNLEDCTTQYTELAEQYNALTEEYNETLEKVEELCGETYGVTGSYSHSALVVARGSSGSCFSNINGHWGQNINTAILSPNVSSGVYRLLQTSASLRALYRTKFVSGTGDVKVPLNPALIDDYGKSSCARLTGEIQIREYNSTATDPVLQFSSPRSGIETGAAGIGIYGIFHRTNYNRADGQPNPYLIGWINKETADDVFSFSDQPGLSCSESDPNNPTKFLNYQAGAGGYFSYPSSNYQAIPSGSNGLVVTAQALGGYIFTGWSDGVETTSRTDLNVTSDLFVTANFEKII